MVYVMMRSGFHIGESCWTVGALR